MLKLTFSSKRVLTLSLLFLGACTRGPFSLKNERRVIENPLYVFANRVTPFASLGGNSEFLVLGTAGGHVELRRSQNGSVVWRSSFDSAVMTRPSICGNSVLTGFSDGSLVSLDLKSGKTQWTYVAASSLVGHISCKDNMVFAGTNQGHFYALAAQTGVLAWSLRQDAGDHMTVQSFALIDSEKNTYVVAFSNGVVVSVDKEGNTVWTSGVDSTGARDFRDISSITRVDADSVLVSQYEGHASLLRDSDGKPQWQLENGGSLARGFSETDRLFMPMANQTLALLDKKGSLIWKWQAPQGPGWTGFSGYKQFLLASSGDGSVYVVEKNSGKFVWKYDLGTPILGDALVVNHGFWVLSQKGQLMKFSE